MELKGKEFTDSLACTFKFLIKMLGNEMVQKSVQHTKIIIEILNLVVEGNMEYYKMNPY